VSIDPTATAVLESDVIRRAQEGDADAFATLFHSHKTRVYSLCLRMTKNTAEAEDLTQEAFLHVFRKLAAFRADSALSTWLYRVTVNTVLMHFRKKSLCRVSLDRPSGGDEFGRPMPREFPTTDVRLTGCVDRVALSRALADLPEGYRKIFLLHEVDGYEHREIARFLGCSVGNSKSQLHKARQRIREFLAAPEKAHAEAPRRTKMKVASKQVAARWNSLPRADVPRLRGPITTSLPQLVQTSA
jgi:RNA polymerase sigma-70 factor, ECF subfamily